MRHRLFNLLAALSLLAGIAVAGVWVRSYWAREQLVWVGRHLQGWQRTVMIGCVHGASFIVVTDRFYVDGDRQEGWRREASRPLGSGRWWWEADRLGFTIDATEMEIREVGWKQFDRALWLPCWFLVGACAILPLSWLMKAILRRRARSYIATGHCRQCGYDLRATPGLRPRCPECGTIAKAPTPNPEPRTTNP